METLNQILILFLLLIIGYMSKKFRVISNDMNHDLSSFVLNVALPALIITSLGSFEFSKEMLIKSGNLFMISWGVYALSIAVSYGIPRILKAEGTDRDIFQFMIVFSNVGFMGYPVVNAVFGEKGVFYAALYNLPFNILLWSFGVMVLSRPAMEKGKPVLDRRGSLLIRQLFNPGLVAVFIGFAMFMMSFRLPGPIFKTLKMVGDVTTPMSMVFIGSILADIHVKEIFSNVNIFIVSAVRLVIVPMLVWLILKQFPLDEIMVGIPVVIAAMPVAANCAILATRYGNDYYLASQAVFISTMLSMITIPLIVALL
ncbi:AEC family transporter [Thermotalea metallivorans]|uniref:Transporter YfdV n=1 Tax=Thermotalea metallivorans TaxID=520762 RepID=A0A140L6Y3_9FIRM|nr:AEC family transporter [Thermotalea metallivorans]KXG76308.1 hypothetical protein AN619_12650 [Thermotalea metallivorans]